MIYAAPGVPFEATFEGPTGLTGTLGRRIVDGQGATTVARFTTGIVETPADSGVYVATQAAPVTGGQYVLVWDTGGASPAYASEDLTISATVVPVSPPAGSGYPTTVALVAGSSVDELLSLTSAQQDALRAAAIAAVEEFTNQRFEPYTETKLLDGAGGRELYLPARIESLTGITINGVNSPITGFALSEDNGRLIFSGYIGNYYERALADLSDPISTFKSGAGSVAITATWGWGTTPSAVVTAIRYEMEDLARSDQSVLAPTMATYRRLGMRSIDQGNLRANISPLPPNIGARAASILRGRYVWEGEIGRAV